MNTVYININLVLYQVFCLYCYILLVARRKCWIIVFLFNVPTCPNPNAKRLQRVRVEANLFVVGKSQPFNDFSRDPNADLTPLNSAEKQRWFSSDHALPFVEHGIAEKEQTR